MMFLIFTFILCLAFNCSLNAQDASIDTAYEKAAYAAVQKVAPSVALIETTGGQDILMPNAVRKVVGPTTGLVVTADGLIVTSSFNFSNKPTDIFVTLPGKGRAVAKVIGTDTSRMITLLRVDLKDLPVPTPYPRNDFQVGMSTLALGRTLDPNVSKLPSVAGGIVSAINRIWGKAVQTDAKVSPTNYGGPLVALDGRVMGVLVPASAEGGESDNAGSEWYDSGIGFAIPLEDVLKVIPKLAKGTPEKPVILRGGIFGIPAPQPPQFLDAPKLSVITPKSAAEEAGLKAGDIVSAVNGHPVNTLAQMLHTIKPLYEGDSISLKVMRSGKEIDIPKLTLKGVVTDISPGFLGILPMRDDPELGVEIRSVYPDSPADKAGLKVGDRLMKLAPVGIDQLQPFAGRNQLMPLLSLLQADADVQFEVKRKEGKTEKLTIRLTTMPETLPDKFPNESSKKQALVAPKPVGPVAKKGPVVKKDPEAPKQEKKEEKKDDAKVETGLIQKTNKEQGHNYWVYVPANYDPNVSHGLIVWLHPAGVEGMDAKEITSIWREVCEEFNFIMLGPITKNKDGWLPSETEYILQDIRTTMGSYTIDRYRVAAHGSGIGGQMAFYVGFNERDLIRGVAAVGSVLGTQPKDNLPSQRLSFFIAAGQKDPLLKDIKESRAKLEKKKYPVIYREMEEIGKQYIYEDVKAIQDLVRWFESLDRM